MPYPNEHAARMTSPGKYVRVRRQNDAFGQGIDKFTLLLGLL